MDEFIRSFVFSIQRAKTTLIVTHEYLPLSLAVVLPALVKSLQAQQKEVTVLVSKEPYGWMQSVDAVYPIDMVLTLDEVKQVISIPVSSEDFGALSYEVIDNTLNITVTPGNATIEFDKLQTMLYGSTYDVVVGLGVTATHPLVETLSRSPASLGNASFFFVGSISPVASLQQAIPFAKEIRVLENTTGEAVLQLAHEMQGGATTQESRELLAAYLFAQSKFKNNDLSEKSWGILQQQVRDGIDTSRMAQLFAEQPNVINTRIQTILSSCVLSEKKDVAVFSMRQGQLASLNVTPQEIVATSYYLPAYAGVSQYVVLVEESAYEHHVVVYGKGDTIKRIAIKYGFPYTTEVTGGRVSEVVFDKLFADVTRVVAEEEMSVSMRRDNEAVQRSSQPVVPISNARPIAHATVPVSASIEQIAQQVTMQNDQQVGSTVPAPASAANVSQYSQSQQTQPVEQPQVAPQVPATQPIPVVPGQKVGLDFASIARKMREQIDAQQPV
jgi:hypothetical protein